MLRCDKGKSSGVIESMGKQVVVGRKVDSANISVSDALKEIAALKFACAAYQKKKTWRAISAKQFCVFLLVF